MPVKDKPFVIENIGSKEICAATIFLFGNINWRTLKEQDLQAYQEKLAELEKAIIQHGFSEKTELVAEVHRHVNPKILPSSYKHLRLKKAAILYSYGRSGVADREKRLKALGLPPEPIAEVDYSVVNDKGEDWGFRNDILSYFKIGELVKYARDFRELGLDFLLAENRAALEDKKILVTPEIHKKMADAGKDVQPQNVYWVEGREVPIGWRR